MSSLPCKQTFMGMHCIYSEFTACGMLCGHTKGIDSSIKV